MSARRQPRKVIPKCLFGQVGFCRPGMPRTKKNSFFKKIMILWPCRRRRQGQRTTSVLENVWFVGHGTPSLPKNTWPKKHFRIPLMYTVDVSHSAKRVPEKGNLNSWGIKVVLKWPSEGPGSRQSQAKGLQRATEVPQ